MDDNFIETYQAWKNYSAVEVMQKSRNEYEYKKKVIFLNNLYPL